MIKQIKDISAISDSELNRIVVDFNNTAAEYPKDKCVHQLFEEQVKKAPDKTAVIACDKTLTYAELNEQANRIAHSLIRQGVGVGDIVAFALPRKSYLISTMLGILKTGAAYLPIDPDYPQERIEYMLKDSMAKTYIDESNLRESLNSSNTQNPNVAMSNESICYCIYTSGSTGKPKGTLLTHKCVVNYVNNNNNNVVHKIIRSSYKSIVSVTTVGFDIFVTESLLPLSNGMEIVLANEEQAKFPQQLNDLIAKHPVEVLQTTPTKMKSLISDNQQIDYLKKLKTIILGGEALEDNLIKRLNDITNAKIFNIYGPTETTVWSTNAQISDADTITIGKPIANTQIYIVDKYMQPTPIGVTGELCIAGDGVGAGYLNRPELTAEKFINNPFGEGKLYKTGDLAYWREDGNIVYIGRNDFLVKIRGLRIELGEIENAMLSVDGISQAVVVVRKNAEGRQLICAFYTGAETDAKEIRNHIGRKLPKYMLPHIFTHLAQMPLTSSGKVNRKALPEAELENIANDTEYAAPENKQQKELCELMKSVLGTTLVGITDDFFDLGGDSLKAIEFISAAHNSGIEIALQNIFDYPTVKQLSDYLEGKDNIKIKYNLADFKKYNALLQNNVMTDAVPQKKTLGNVLITGSTGFLGIHILAEFLEQEKGIAYCLVRGKDYKDAENRFKKHLEYYFGNKYSDLLGKRIIIRCGDITKSYLGLDNIPKVDTVIHAAATVKHYGPYSYFEKINVNGTKNVIAFAKKSKAKLIHISTIGVSGNSLADNFNVYKSEDELFFDETCFYIGQPLDNVYVRSKFEAERAVLDAAIGGLDCKILRVGNLTNRASDLKFQPNYTENAFLKRFKAFIDIGVFPDYLMRYAIEFSPIDKTAQAVMKVAQYADKQCIFHLGSNREIEFEKLFEIFKEIGIKINIVSGDKFGKVLNDSSKSDETRYIYETFQTDSDENGNLLYDSNIRIAKDFSIDFLKKVGFEWNEMDFDYISRYVEYFRKLGYLK